ncbi:MAG TPA: head GIN domain-containing protein [Sunxiuqinia sp.]|nr:head GIN domain-containing protein [Sunxiuqinia sp.]
MKTNPGFLIVLLIFLLVNPFVSYASSNLNDNIERTYNVSNFNKIYLEGGYKVILEQSSTPGLRIKADEEAFDYIHVESDENTLRLTITKKHLDFERMTLYISFTDLRELHIEGGVKLETVGFVDLNDFKLDVEGGALVKMGMKVNNLVVIGEGGVSFNLRGVAKELHARISGAGRLDAEELKSENVSFKIEGVGWGSVYATNHLSASINGVGKINYKGNPEVDKDIQGVGFISND